MNGFQIGFYGQLGVTAQNFALEGLWMYLIVFWYDYLKNWIFVNLYDHYPFTDRLFGDESDFLFWTVALYYLRAVKWSPKSQVRLDSSWVLPNKSANKPHSKGLNSFYSSGGFVLNLNYNYKAL